MSYVNSKVYAVIPAAGIGRRMGADIPKQYLKLKNKLVIEHTIERLLSINFIERVVVVIAAHDEVWSTLPVSKEPRVLSAKGGKERCHSVLNGLQTLVGEPTRASGDSWVLVHDAARPCVRSKDIIAMVNQLRVHAVGGILAAPVRDTLKKASHDNSISSTVDRTALWHAFTPQMFRVKTLSDALGTAIASENLVTDEAQAIERCGLVPQLIEGHSDNLKITQPEDLILAGLYLESQKATGDC